MGPPVGGLAGTQADGAVKRALQAASFEDVVRCKYVLRLQQHVRGPCGSSLPSMLPYGDCLLSAEAEDVPAALAWMEEHEMGDIMRLYRSLSPPAQWLHSASAASLSVAAAI